ncbi:ribosomal protein L1 [Peniophora sp. CONT]|nr:ribosomal protein L1 [Peniophora sp. CONT]
MAGSDLIDERVSIKQCKKAVDALLAHASKKQAEAEESSLLGGKEQHIWLQVAVKKMHPEHKLKPFKIPVKYPLVDPRVTPICLITKDPQREYKDLLDSHDIKFINRVVGITKLKGKFKPYEARRMLLQENGLFLADERVVTLLPGLLGKKFFDAKKQPIPVNLTRKDLKGELERAISSTYMHQNQGTCTSIKIATLTHTPAQVLANLQTALPSIAKATKGGWENIQSLNIKTSNSTALPIWTVELGEQRWVTGEEKDEDMAEIEEIEAEKEEGVVEKVGKKGKKRTAEEVVEEGTPAKKVKGAKVVAAAAESSQDDSTPVKKKRKPSDFIDSAVPAPSTSISAVPEKKKKRKSAATSEIPPPDTPVVASANEADVESSDPSLVEPALSRKEKKKKRKSVAAAEEVEEPLVAAATAVVEDVEVAEATPSKKEKKSKKEKVKEPVEPAPTPATPMTPKEKKEKRAAGGGEKKKEKAVKGKKSAAKEGVLGRSK